MIFPPRPRPAALRLNPWRAIAIAALLASCNDASTAPSPDFAVTDPAALADSLLTGSPGAPLRDVRVRAVTVHGEPVAGARVVWTAGGTAARVDAASSFTDADGFASGRWILGTTAGSQTLVVAVTSRGGLTRTQKLMAEARPSVVAQLLVRDTIEVKLGQPADAGVRARDPFGNEFAPADVQYAALDSGIVGIDSGRVVGRRRGAARLVVAAGSARDTVLVRVTQTVARIVPAADSIRFGALGITRALDVELLDEFGQPVLDSLPIVRVQDTTVASVRANGGPAFLSLRNGSTSATLIVGGVETSVRLVVTQLPASAQLDSSAVAFDALGDSVRVAVTVRDSAGAAMPGASVVYHVDDAAVAVATSDGDVVSTGNGTTRVIATAGPSAADTLLVTVAQRIARVALAADSLSFAALTAERDAGAVAVDRRGVRVADASVALRSDDERIAAITPAGAVRAVANGLTAVWAVAGTDSSRLAVRVQQVPRRLRIAPDSLLFDALGQTQALSFEALDSLGITLAGASWTLASADTTVAAVRGDSVTAHGAGRAALTVTVAGLQGVVPAVISQRVTRIVVARTDTLAIADGRAGDALGVSCLAYDRNGFEVEGRSLVAASARATVSGATCDALSLARSGYDTLRVTADGVQATLPLVVALRPVVTEPIGHFLTVDSMPASSFPWAPSLRRRSDGRLELYATAYQASDAGVRGHLHRYVSDDGESFRYDGMAIPRDDSLCAPRGVGVENMAVVRRADGDGWRMFFAAGADDCYGWQVFSAVSSDERNWTIEPGVRMDNGSTGRESTVYWPTGEGLVIDRLPTGEWRAVIGAFERTTPAQGKWQIIEWRSADQVDWYPVGTVLHNSSVPSGATRSIYSPTIREFAPGLYRMIFTGDDFDQPGGRSRLFSAVSTDREHWQLEGELLGAPGTSLYYSSLVDDHLVFVRRDDGQSNRLAAALVTMP